MALAESLDARFKDWGVQEYTEVAFQVLLVAGVGICVTIPMLMLILQALSPTEITHELSWALSLVNFTTVLTQPIFINSIKNTFIFSLGSVVIAHLIGFVFAYMLTRMDVPFRSVFHTLLFLPIFLSPLVLSLGYSFAFNDGGYYHTLLSAVAQPISITNIWGMVFVSSIWLTPFTYSFLSAGLQNIDPDMEDAGRLTGATERTIISQITVPLLKPFVLSSLFLTILLTFQEISIPAILGLPDRQYVLATYILGLEGMTVPPPYGKMAAVGVVMVIVSVLIVFAIQRIIGDVSEYTVITGRGRARNIHTSRGKQALAVAVLSGYILLFIVVPLLQVISVGITREGGVSMITFGNLSLKWFEELASRSGPINAIKNTLTIALVTASASVVLTGIISYITNRVEGFASDAMGWLAWIPIGTPGIVLGLAYLWTLLVFNIGLYGTIFALMLAFFIRFLALGMRMNSSLITQQAVEIDEQAKICGAGLFSRLRHVIFPNAKTGMLSVWVVLFTLFMNELSTSIFLYTSQSRVITVTVFELWYSAQYGVLGALSTVQVLITLSVVTTILLLFDVEIRAV